MEVDQDERKVVEFSIDGVILCFLVSAFFIASEMTKRLSLNSVV
jgi:hypothetical protein